MRRALATLSNTADNKDAKTEKNKSLNAGISKKKPRKPRTTVLSSRIYENILKSENTFRINLPAEHTVQYDMRAIVVDWLHEVASEYRFQWETLLLSVNIFDRYIHLRPVTVEKMQLIGVTAMFLASKYEEIHPPRIHDFAYMCDSAYTNQEIVKTENEVMSVLDWNICCPTAGRFLEYYTTLYPFSAKTKAMAQVFIDCFLQERPYLSYPGCKVAGAALRLACYYAEKIDIDTLKLDKHLSGDMIHLCYIINAAYAKISNRKSLRHALSKHNRSAVKPLAFKEFKHQSVEV